MIPTLLLSLLLLTPSSPAKTSWQRHASPVQDDLHNAFFLDDINGWILAHQSGAVLRTTDGGTTWKVQARLGEGFLESIYFSDARNGWICGDKGRLYRTTDGGETWTLRSFGDGLAFYVVRFVDARKGFLAGLDPAAGRAVLLETFDGGGTWTRREDLPAVRGYSDALEFPSPSVGFLGGFGAILATRDGGKTWTVAHEVKDGVIRDLRAQAEKKQWAVGHGGLVLRSREDGTWEQLPPFTKNRLRSVVFADSQRGWLAGDANREPGTLFETTDGGKTWTRVEIEAPDLHRFALSHSRIWLVGKGGTIMSRPRRC